MPFLPNIFAKSLEYYIVNTLKLLIRIILQFRYRLCYVVIFYWLFSGLNPKVKTEAYHSCQFVCPSRGWISGTVIVRHIDIFSDDVFLSLRLRHKTSIFFCYASKLFFFGLFLKKPQFITPTRTLPILSKSSLPIRTI